MKALVLSLIYIRMPQNTAAMGLDYFIYSLGGYTYSEFGERVADYVSYSIEALLFASTISLLAKFLFRLRLKPTGNRRAHGTSFESIR